jgi:hypothetical protein
MAGFGEIENSETSKSESEIEALSAELIEPRKREATIGVRAGTRDRACSASIDQQVSFVIGTAMSDHVGRATHTGDINRLLV